MPLKSKAQQRKFRVLEAEGQLPAGTTDQWLDETPGGIKSLPERKGKRAKLVQRDKAKSRKRITAKTPME